MYYMARMKALRRAKKGRKASGKAWLLGLPLGITRGLQLLLVLIISLIASPSWTMAVVLKHRQGSTRVTGYQLHQAALKSQACSQNCNQRPVCKVRVRQDYRMRPITKTLTTLLLVPRLCRSSETISSQERLSTTTPPS